jgi:hypothetical protein
MPGLAQKPHGPAWPRETPAAAPPAGELQTLAGRLGVAWPLPLTPDNKLPGYLALEIMRDVANSERPADAEKFTEILKAKDWL